jgi:hypothetical protein
LERRIEAHIFVSFLAYCLHVSLRACLRPLAPGLTPRSLLEKFAAIQMLDVHFPTTDGRELVFCRYTQPEKDHKMLLAQLGWELPPQSPPRITQKGQLLPNKFGADLLKSGAHLQPLTRSTTLQLRKSGAGAHLIEQLLDVATILQRVLQHCHHRSRHIEATPFSILGVGEQVVGVFDSAGASPAMGADAGLMHQGQRTFERGPQGGELLQEARLHRGF